MIADLTNELMWPDSIVAKFMARKSRWKPMVGRPRLSSHHSSNVTNTRSSGI